MNELAVYFDKIADEFNGYYAGRRPSIIQEAGYRIFRAPGLKRRFADTVKMIGDRKGSKILDVGCGPGVYALYFAKNGAYVTGIDISGNMIEFARKNLSEARIQNFKLINGDFMTHNFTEDFDYTLAIGLFDYINKTDRGGYLEKLKSVTKYKIIVTFPKRYTPQMPIRRAMFFIKNQPVYFYTKSMIMSLANAHGLKTTIHNSGPIWTVGFVKS